MSKKVIAVTGATGAQGGGLVRAILADAAGGFTVRAITRDVNSPKAAELRALGADVVAGDVDDAASLERAFAGAHGAYAVTFYWAHMSPERELAQARNLAQAAARARVPHVIWSTLEDTRRWIPLDDPRMPTLMGTYKVPHFDAKGEADRFFTELGVPTTFLLASFYWDNLLSSGPKPGPDGTPTLVLPIGNAKMAGVAASDIGRVAYALFAGGAKHIGQRVGAAGELLTGAEMAAKMTRALGTTVRFQDVPPEVFRGFGFPGADDLGNMFQFYRDFADVCNATRDVARCRALVPGMMDFDAWLARHARSIPLK